MKIILFLLAAVLLAVVSAQNECELNFRKNQDGVCIRIENCCFDANCNPLYIANPTYNTEVKKIVIPYAVFKRYPYSIVKECPPHFKKVGEKTCIHEVKVSFFGFCPLTYFRVNRRTCIKVVTITDGKDLEITCPFGQRKYKGRCVEFGRRFELKEIENSKEEIVCPRGYKKVGKYECVKVLLCPKGYKRTQHGCSKVKIQCPHGYRRVKNTCYKLKKCPRGTLRKNGKCIRFSRKLCGSCPQVKCAKGFFSTRVKGRCCKSCVKCKCSKYFDPVCATNGVTFRNKCDALCQGFKIKHRGTCNKPCNGRCPTLVKPVCGRDGLTYRNRCVLRSNLVDFRHNGKCKSRVVKDPKDRIVKKIKREIKRKLKSYRVFISKRNIKICNNTKRFLEEKLKKINKRKSRVYRRKLNKKRENKEIKYLNKLHKRYLTQYNAVTKDCKKHKRITKKNKYIIYEMLSDNYRFKRRWLFNVRSLTKKQKKINDKKMNVFKDKLTKCREKSLSYKKKWNRYFQVKRRSQIEKINRAKSQRAKKYLRRAYARHRRHFKLRIQRSLARLNRRCKRIEKRRNEFTSRYFKELKMTTKLRNRVEKYRNQLKAKLTEVQRTEVNNKLENAQKRFTKYFENVTRRSFIRQRRYCIRNYARTVRDFNNYRSRQLRNIRRQNIRRIRNDNFLKKRCLRSKDKNCYVSKKSKRDARRKVKDAKKDAKRKKTAERLKNKIEYLKKTCDKLHQKAQPFLKSNKVVYTKSFKVKKMTVKSCNKSHKVIVQMRKELRYRTRKTQLKKRNVRTNKRCNLIKNTLRNKRVSCKNNKKCIRKLNRRIRKINRICSRRIKRTRKQIRRNNYRFRHEQRIFQRNQKRFQRKQVELRKAKASSKKIHGQHWIRYYLVKRAEINAKYRRLTFNFNKKIATLLAKRCKRTLKNRIANEKRKSESTQRKLVQRHKLNLIRYSKVCKKRFGKNYKKCFNKLKNNCIYHLQKRIRYEKKIARKFKTKINRQRRRCARYNKRMNKYSKKTVSKKVSKKVALKKKVSLKKQVKKIDKQLNFDRKVELKKKSFVVKSKTEKKTVQKKTVQKKTQGKKALKNAEKEEKEENVENVEKLKNH
jgi:hypothetical protein